MQVCAIPRVSVIINRLQGHNPNDPVLLKSQESTLDSRHRRLRSLAIQPRLSSSTRPKPTAAGGQVELGDACHPPMRLYTCPSTCPHVHAYADTHARMLPIQPSMQMSINMHTHRSTHTSTRRSTHLPTHLPTHMSVHTDLAGLGSGGASCSNTTLAPSCKLSSGVSCRA